MTVNCEDSGFEFGCGYNLNRAANLRDYLDIAPIAAAEENQSRTTCIRESEKPGKIKIGRYDDPIFAVRQGQEFRIRGAMKPEFACMNRIMPFRAERTGKAG